MKNPNRKIAFYRQCVVCREIKHKSELTRLGKTPEGEFSLSGSAGRGAYVCSTPECLAEACKKRAFNRAFRGNIPNEVYTALAERI